MPAAVRLSLWVTTFWSEQLERGSGRSGLSTLDEAVRLAQRDLDVCEMPLDRLHLWSDLGEQALFVALPGPGRLTGLPRCDCAAQTAAITAGEAVFVAGLGGLLTPTFDTFGRSDDQGWRVTWTAFDASPVPRHEFEMLDLRELDRQLREAVLDSARALDRATLAPLGSTGAGRTQDWSGRNSADLSTITRARMADPAWGLPPQTPPAAARVMQSAARLSIAASEGRQAGPALQSAGSMIREQALAGLAATADEVLAGAANVAAMTIAGWR